MLLSWNSSRHKSSDIFLDKYEQNSSRNTEKQVLFSSCKKKKKRERNLQADMIQPGQVRSMAQDFYLTAIVVDPTLMTKRTKPRNLPFDYSTKERLLVSLTQHAVSL